MMLHNYELEYNRRPVNTLECYCKIEGLDALYINSQLKKEMKQQNHKKARVFKQVMSKLREKMNRSKKRDIIKDFI